MRKLLLVTVFSGLILPAVENVQASEKPVEPIEVRLSEIEYGTFNVNRREKVGTRLPVYEATDYLNSRTDEIPIEKNLSFGSRFRIDADRGRVLQFLTVWSMPAMDVPGRKEPVQQKATLGQGENHEVYKFTYMLDEPWEMQPGEWTLQVFLVGVDKKRVKKLNDINKSPYWIEVYRETFTLTPPGEM